MDYEEALTYEPTRQKIDREIKEHGCDPVEFWQDVASPTNYRFLKGTMTGRKVMDWLGY